MESFKKLLEKIFKNAEGANKKRFIENCVFFIILGIIIVVTATWLFGSESKKQTTIPSADTGSTKQVSASASADSTNLEKRAETIISQINGVGKVDIMVTYESSSEKVPAYDTKNNDSTTNEKDKEGGTRVTDSNNDESSVVFDGDKNPVIVKEMEPKIKGVVVVAEGASNQTVAQNILKAVKTLFDVPLYKIQVFEKNN